MSVRSRGINSESCENVAASLVASYRRTRIVQRVGVVLIGIRR